jgi:DNA-damage-inducible protein D
MSNDNTLAVFEHFKIRRVYDEKAETWYFSVVDIIAALIQQPDYQTARKYWNKLKERLKKEGSQSVTNCHQLKLKASDGKRVVTGENFLPPGKRNPQIGADGEASDE